VGVWNKEASIKVNGVVIPGKLVWVKDIDVDIQPYNKALLLKNYGYDIEVNKRVYVDYFESAINVGTVLKYTDQYGKEINLSVKIIPWDDGYMEVICLGI
jgi:hypothetical protein